MKKHAKRWWLGLFLLSNAPRRSASPRRLSTRPLRCEALEERRVLSVSPVPGAVDGGLSDGADGAFYGAAVPGDEVVTFADENLEAAVREELGMPTGDLTRGVLETVTYLRAWQRGISDLAGIEACVNLASLALPHNKIGDLSPVAELTDLEFLDLRNNQIEEISALALLQQLEMVELGANGISDVSALADLSGLQVLSLYSNSLSDVSPLATLTGLRSLALSANSISDIASLASLTDLEVLQLQHNAVTDISAISSLTQLHHLSLSGNPIDDFSTIADLKGLEGLALLNTAMTDADLGTVAGLASLATLDIGGNDISDMTPLAGLAKLVHLSAGRNMIESIEPLAELTQLKGLYLNDNRIHNVTPLASLPMLFEVWLHDNQVTDISALTEATNLGHGDRISLNGNPLSEATLTEQIPVLIARGVEVTYDLAGGPYETTVGSSIWLHASFPDATHQYAWDLDGDGEFDDAFGASVRYSAGAAGTVEVGLQVTDSFGNTDTGTGVINTAANLGMEIIGAEAVMNQGAEVVLEVVGDSASEGTLTWSTKLDGIEVATGTGTEFALPTDMGGDYLVTVTSTADGVVVGTATEAIRVVRDLGPIDSTMIWTAVEASNGDVFHRVQATRDARLTLEGLPRESHHEIELTLYDADFRPLGTSVKVGDNFRVEWEALPGETYYFTMTAPAVTEVRILNAIAEGDGQVTVYGSAATDTVQLGDRQGGMTILLNGIEYEFESQTSVTYHGNGGGDTVALFDSAESDTFHVKPGEVAVSNDTGSWSVKADGYSVLLAYSVVGGQDKAFLYDSAGSDKFKADPKVAKMLRHGDYYNRMKLFSQVYALAENGGNDVARLQGSSDDDQLTAQKDETRLEGQSFGISAKGFRDVIAWGMGGQDVATLTDSALDDTVRARPHKVSMWAGRTSSPNYEIVARNFGSVSLQATQGGFDKAKLHDSAFDDVLELDESSARMNIAPEIADGMYEAVAFEWIKAYTTSGNDKVSGREDPHTYEMVFYGVWDEG